MKKQRKAKTGVELPPFPLEPSRPMRRQQFPRILVFTCKSHLRWKCQGQGQGQTPAASKRARPLQMVELYFEGLNSGKRCIIIYILALELFLKNCFYELYGIFIYIHIYM